MYVNDNMNEIFYYDNDISNDWTHFYEIYYKKNKFIE